MSEPDALILAQDGQLATITLNRPRYRNAVDLAMLFALERAIDTLRFDPPRVAILRATSPGFCSGIDLKESLDATPEFAFFRVSTMPPSARTRSLKTSNVSLRSFLNSVPRCATTISPVSSR